MPPIVPCSSVNSRTRSVPRSALASRPAFAADAASAGLCSASRATHSARMLEALGLDLVAAGLLVEQDRVQPFDTGLERHLAVGLPEKLRVAQPRREHPLRVAADELGPVHLDVGHREEGRLQLAVFVHHREVVLVMDHRRRQHFLGQREELGRETRRRPPMATPPDPAPRRAARPDLPPRGARVHPGGRRGRRGRARCARAGLHVRGRRSSRAGALCSRRRS